MVEDALTKSRMLTKWHQGELGGYTINGIWYEDHGAWRIVLVSHGIQELYWVCGDEIRFAEVNVGRNSEIFGKGLATDLDPALRQGILNTIKAWEKQKTDASAAFDRT